MGSIKFVHSSAWHWLLYIVEEGFTWRFRQRTVARQLEVRVAVWLPAQRLRKALHAAFWRCRAEGPPRAHLNAWIHRLAWQRRFDWLVNALSMNAALRALPSVVLQFGNALLDEARLRFAKVALGKNYTPANRAVDPALGAARSNACPRHQCGRR